MVKNLSKKSKLKLILMIIIWIVFYAIISDWNHFKAGLFGIT